MEVFSVAGKTALVTGASSGLGAHFAQILAEGGAQVALAARRADRLEALARTLRKAGAQALPVSMDVTDPASVEAGFEALEAAFGEPARIVVNNSGVSREAWFTRMSEEDWASVVDTNLSGVWRVAKRACAALVEAGGGGSVINISSITAYRPSQTLGAYASSKAAVDHLTRVMALEMARFGVRVNAIAPGYFKTEINDAFLESEEGEAMRKRVPMRRFGDYGELSGALLLLASQAGSYMTGSTLVVDGGHLQSPL